MEDNSQGKVHVFARSSGTLWNPEAHLQASNAGQGDEFGSSVALSGITLVIGAPREDSNGNPSDNTIVDSGAVYIFERNAGSWSERAYLKASVIIGGNRFGKSVSLSADACTLAVLSENGVSIRSCLLSWSENAFFALKRPNSLIISGDGSHMFVGLSRHLLNPLGKAGMVVRFDKTDGMWAQNGTLFASNAGGGDAFGASLATGLDGSVLFVGAEQEESVSATNELDDGADDSGAAYIFSPYPLATPRERLIRSFNPTQICIWVPCQDRHNHFGSSFCCHDCIGHLCCGAVQRNLSVRWVQVSCCCIICSSLGHFAILAWLWNHCVCAL